MADGLSVTLDTREWDAKIAALGRRAPIAIARGLNKTASSVRAVLARAVAQDMGLKVAVARGAMAISRASAATLSARVVAKGKRLPLIDFKARALGRGGVSYVGEGGQRKRIAQAFIATMPHSGHRGVFMRVTRKRLPIKQLYGASIAQVFAKQIPVGEARRNELLVQNVGHEIEFELTRLQA